MIEELFKYFGIGITAIVYFISSLISGGGRVDEETETMGLDEAVHGERGFNL